MSVPIPDHLFHTPITRAYWRVSAADDHLCMMCNALDVTLSGHRGTEETTLGNIERDWSDVHAALEDFRRVVFDLTHTAGVKPDHPSRDLVED